MFFYDGIVSCIDGASVTIIWCLHVLIARRILLIVDMLIIAVNIEVITLTIRVITKLPNSEQSYKGKVKTHNYINRQNQSITGKL